MTEQQLNGLLNAYPTPCYVFDLGALNRRVEYLKAKLAGRADLCYAMKANAFLTGELVNTVERFEVCSPGEYHICQRLGIPAEKLVISGVYKAPADVEDMVGNQPNMGWYTAESVEQFRLLHEAAQRHNRKIRVLLRLTSGSQFGLDKEELTQIVAHREEYPLIHLSGVQYFSGTQKHTTRRLKKELDKLALLLETLEQEFDYQAEELEFGAGFPVYYFQGEEFDEETFLDEFAALLEPLSQKWNITIELGRSIAASCGTYLTSVVDTKTNKGQNYAILDGGMNHLVYFGQTMAMKVPHYQLLPVRENSDPQPWNLCGSLCTTNDLIVKQLPVSNLQKGDVFAFENTGAYCMTEGISLFLSRDLPSVVLVKADGTAQLVRQQVPTYPLNTPQYE